MASYAAEDAEVGYQSENDHDEGQDSPDAEAPSFVERKNSSKRETVKIRSLFASTSSAVLALKDYPMLTCLRHRDSKTSWANWTFKRILASDREFESQMRTDAAKNLRRTHPSTSGIGVLGNGTEDKKAVTGITTDVRNLLAEYGRALGRQDSYLDISDAFSEKPDLFWLANALIAVLRRGVFHHKRNTWTFDGINGHADLFPKDKTHSFTVLAFGSDDELQAPSLGRKLNEHAQGQIDVQINLYPLSILTKGREVEDTAEVVLASSLATPAAPVLNYAFFVFALQLQQELIALAKADTTNDDRQAWACAMSNVIRQMPFACGAAMEMCVRHLQNVEGRKSTLRECQGKKTVLPEGATTSLPDGPKIVVSWKGKGSERKELTFTVFPTKSKDLAALRHEMIVKEAKKAGKEEKPKGKGRKGEKQAWNTGKIKAKQTSSSSESEDD